MLVSLTLPEGLPGFATGVVRTVHVGPGSVIVPGTALVEFTLDLSGGRTFDCPPEAHYCLTAAEPGVIATIAVVAGQAISADVVFGMLDVAGSAVADVPARAARVTVASMLLERDWWDEDD